MHHASFFTAGFTPCFAVLLGTAFIFPAAGSAQDSPRERTSFNAGWRFQKDDPADTGDALSYEKIKPALIASTDSFLRTAAISSDGVPVDIGKDVSYTQPGFDDSAWRAVALPHDWGIEGPFDQKYPGETGKLPWWGVGWYRKHFNVDAEKTAGRKYFLQIDGAMSYSSLWLNGKFVGGWPYGYASYQLDLTPFIKVGGENVIAIRLDNPPNSSRWYPGGGIYRNVWLLKTAPVHVAQWGTYITTPVVSSTSATVRVKTEISMSLKVTRPDLMHFYKTEIYSLDENGLKTGAAVAVDESSMSFAKGPTYGDGTFTSDIKIKNPKLWSIEKPNLYVAVTKISQDGKVLDSYETVFGIRTAQFTTDNGFLLNGKRVALNGVCDHHDLGALGSAINTRALQRQLEILKSMGCNAIRTSHNPPAPELLDLCDRMGFVVMDEAFDCWKIGKKPNGYNLLFDDWSEKDVRALVRRDRNHPCVILWSIGNEIPEQGKAEGPEMAKRLGGFVHDEDATRLTTMAVSDARAGYGGLPGALGVFGYNYKPYEYKKFRAANPNSPLFGSETASCISSRGEYFFPVSDDKSKGEADFQMSSYDLSAPRWATIPDAEFKGQDENPFVAGEFVWTGFDYLGEPTPYNSDTTNLLNFTDPAEQEKMKQDLAALGKIHVPSRSSYFGIIDLAGFPKDRYYIYQARWRPDFPMAHILPHWNWPDRVGQVTPVFVYTSGDEAELFLNGKSLGRKTKAKLEYRLRWDDVVYAPGELKVVAYKNGKKWAGDVVKTTGDAAKVTLKADRPAIKADGADLSYVTVSIADKDGLMVPRTHNAVKFEISGPGEIVATDNGDATDLTEFASHQRKAFNGLALVIVRGKPGEAGAIKLTAASEGLDGAEITINSAAK
jgi:beta-galactosidase